MKNQSKENQLCLLGIIIGALQTITIVPLPTDVKKLLWTEFFLAFLEEFFNGELKGCIDWLNSLSVDQKDYSYLVTKFVEEHNEFMPEARFEYHVFNNNKN